MPNIKCKKTFSFNILNTKNLHNIAENQLKWQQCHQL